MAGFVHGHQKREWGPVLVLVPMRGIHGDPPIWCVDDERVERGVILEGAAEL